MTRNKQIRALVLSALMVMSVFATTMAFAGSAAASEHNREIDPVNNEGVTVFQGETVWINNSLPSAGQKNFNNYQLNGDEDRVGNSAGNISIPSDAATGSYENSTSNAYFVVKEPTIDDLEIENDRDQDVAGTTIPTESTDSLTVKTEYNFQDSENISFTVTEGGGDGLEITSEVLSKKTPSNGFHNASLDLSDAGTGTYTVSVEGDDELDAASDSVQITVGDTDGVSLELGSSEVTKGDRVQYTVTGAIEGSYHPVAISEGSVSGDLTKVFRNVGDVVDQSVQYDNSTGTNHSVAVVEIDGGNGVGSIATKELVAEDVTVKVYNATNDIGTSSNSDVDLADHAEVTDTTLTVSEGSVTLDNPTSSYVAGSEATVNGTASSGVDKVTLYAKAAGDYQLVKVGNSKYNISVDSDGAFEAEDVKLSGYGSTLGNGILNLPGTYRFAAVAGGNGTGEALSNTMSNSELSNNVSDTTTITVTTSQLTANASIINGQVADGDEITVSGTALGLSDKRDNVEVVFFGPRGGVDNETIDVESDGSFSNEEVSISDDIGQGTVVMKVIAAARDDIYGEDSDSLNTDVGSSTQSQAIDKIASRTVDATGSDDQEVSFQFRHSTARTTIDSAHSAGAPEGVAAIGSDLMITGTTNRQPSGNSLTVAVIDGPSANAFETENVEDWGTDGQWSTNLSTDGLAPGNYTVEVSGPDSSDVADFTLTEDDVGNASDGDTTDAGGNMTESEGGDMTESEGGDMTEAGDDMTEAGDDMTEAGDDSAATTADSAGTTEGSSGSGAGFTAGLALVALLGAALLATRRN